MRTMGQHDAAARSIQAARQLLRFLEETPEKEAIRFGARSLTFGELGRLARAYAGGLARLGIKRGDRVAVFAESSPELIVALVGHYLLGAVHVPINTHYRAEEAGHILSDSGASLLLFGPGLGVEALLAEIGPLPRLAHAIAFGGPFESFLDGGPLPEGTPLPADLDPALLIYTSGTTGKSKGVELSFGAVAANIGAVTSMWAFTPADTLALALPLFHVHGLCLGVHGMLLQGFSVVLFEKFEAGRIVEAFRSSGVTSFMGVPTMYVRLLEHLEASPEAAGPLRSARLFTSGSAPLPADDFRAFQELTGHRILERYGMSETQFTLSNPYEGDRLPGTVGLPVPGFEVRVNGDDGKPVADGELGEIVVRGNGLMTGYWGRPADTAASLRDGWFLTGDVACRDARGYVTIVGRKSVDIIKSGGFKISAREIEDVLRRHPRVREVAVVGAEDRLWGQRIVAAVVLHVPAPGDPPIDPAGFPEELTAFAREHLADFKRPREVLLLEGLPRNALGKVQKHLILKSRGER
jgi:malonyl-CoA/methylmalonyl-CoA synthetase